MRLSLTDGCSVSDIPSGAVRIEEMLDYFTFDYEVPGDCIAEAEKVLCDELVSTLITVAEDVKFQIEFNPSVVKSYRQLGYENRQLETEDFDDDTVDAGEVGSGCCLTVVYEIIPAVAGDTDASGLRYQTSTLTAAAMTDEWMTVSIRYKAPGNEDSELLHFTIGAGDVSAAPSSDWWFVSAVCEFALVLRDSQFKGSSTIDNVLGILKNLELREDAYKAEFTQLVSMLT